MKLMEIVQTFWLDLNKNPSFWALICSLLRWRQLTTLSQLVSDAYRSKFLIFFVMLVFRQALWVEHVE